MLHIFGVENKYKIITNENISLASMLKNIWFRKIEKNDFKMF